MEPVLCVDVGSTFTKAVLVDVTSGELVATAAHPTTLPTTGSVARAGVLEGIAAVLAQTCSAAGVSPSRIDRDALLVCSSAGGGLRLAVVGYERVVTAEAGRRVALSAGGRVAHVHAGPLDASGVSSLRAARPDVVLLVGGTDGGNAEILVHNARRLAIARLRAPIVVAGNAEAAPDAAREFASRGRSVTVTANVLPRIGALEPGPARAAIREAFLAHVIGGKGLARGRLLGSSFAALVRGPTPDVVLTGVEVLADGCAQPAVRGVGDVLVVDVGGATTDVYSVVTPTGEDVVLRREVVAPLWRARTVEADLGMRWNATGVVEAANAEGLMPDADGLRPDADGPRPDADGLRPDGDGLRPDGDGLRPDGDGLRPDERAAIRLREYADRVTSTPSFLPASAADRELEVRLAEVAVRVAVRRHARPTTTLAAPRPLREVRLVVGSGGVLRHADPQARRRILAPVLSDHEGGWRVPVSARLAVDEHCVLFAAGLLWQRWPGPAAHLAASRLTAVDG